MIRDNKAFRGALPKFWAADGERYRKQAHCFDPDSVRDIYERVAARESLQRIGRRHGLYPAGGQDLIRFPANHTGVIMCSHTHDGVTETWAHAVKPVVDSPLWWRANKIIRREPDRRAREQGRAARCQHSRLTG